VVLGLNRVAVRVLDPAQHLDFVGLQLDGLAAPFGLDQRAAAADRAAGRQSPDFAVVIRQGLIGHHLQIGKAGAVVDLDEGKTGLGVTPGTNPAMNCERRSDVEIAGKCAVNRCLGHGFQGP